ncbi:MAG: hypothetical protein ACKOCX_10640, partial [Planctomycetota bacterium]
AGSGISPWPAGIWPTCPKIDGPRSDQPTSVPASGCSPRAHQAFLTHEALAEIARVTVANLARLARGEQPLAGTLVG